MIFRNNTLDTDKDGQEIMQDTSYFFDLFANEADICEYVGKCIPMHWHQEVELFLLMEGKVEIGIGHQTYELTAGEGCFINTEVLHMFKPKESPCRFQSFVFDANIVSGSAGSVFDIQYIRPLLENGPKFMPIYHKDENKIYYEEFRNAFRACEKEEMEYEFQVRESITKILLWIRRKNQISSQKTVSSIQEKRLKEMLNYIEAHLLEAITVKDIAEAANICVRESQRIFKKYMKDSPMEHLQRKRMLQAARLLTETTESITEIAFRCGFSNSGYFTKQFRNVIGQSPREYRMLQKSSGDSGH